MNVAKGRTLIHVPDCVLVLYDRASPLASEGLAAELMHHARENSRRKGSTVFDAWTDALLPFVEAGAVAVWLSMFDGVFNVSLERHESVNQLSSVMNDQFIGASPQHMATLNCPSGDLMVASMGSLLVGKGEPIANVPAGKYLLALERDFEQEAMHGALADLAEYPSGDGPDWTVHVCSLGSRSGT